MLFIILIDAFLVGMLLVQGWPLLAALLAVGLLTGFALFASWFSRGWR